MSITALVSAAALDKASVAGAAQKMTCEGGCGAYFFRLPEYSTFSRLVIIAFPSHLTRNSGNPNATSDASLPADRPRPTPEPEPALCSHLEEQNCSRQCLQTEASPGPSSVPADLVTNSGVSKENASSTRLSLESLKRMVDHIQIAIWIIGSDFLRHQLLEPIVGAALMNYPSLVDDYGLKGQSIYTAFFEHLDMETFVCWECGHTVEEDLEAAIAHQRTMHFRHEPYRCHALNDTW